MKKTLCALTAFLALTFSSSSAADKINIEGWETPVLDGAYLDEQVLISSSYLDFDGDGERKVKFNLYWDWRTNDRMATYSFNGIIYAYGIFPCEINNFYLLIDANCFVENVLTGRRFETRTSSTLEPKLPECYLE